MIEKIKGTWYDYYRMNCVSGHIEMTKVDSLNNPNRRVKGFYSLGKSQAWARLNGKGAWVELVRNPSMVVLDIRDFRNLYSSEEVWETFIY